MRGENPGFPPPPPFKLLVWGVIRASEAHLSLAGGCLQVLRVTGGGSEPFLLGICGGSLGEALVQVVSGGGLDESSS